ncbi:MAG: hypothetical protein GY877_14315 [Hyphomicrobium sp.]|nr:hypothetical protein [Hyphomicrobium sp.]
MEIHFVLITLGGLFLIGLATVELGRRIRLPRVTLLMLFGVLIGPAGLDILPHQAKDWYEFLASTACKSRSNTASLKRPICLVAPD